MNATEPLRVLIVDDEPAILRTLSRTLRLHGYECSEERDPARVLERLDTEVFHVVLTDIVMPGMDGLQLLRELRLRRSLSEVVIMTAYSTLDRAVEARYLGASGYLLKPFESLDQVIEVVHQAKIRFQQWRGALASALGVRDES